MPQGSLQISDEEFFSAPFKNRDAIEDPLLARQEEALFADAPRKVFVDVRQHLPLAVIRVAPFAVAAGVPFDEFAIVAAADVGAGRVRVGRAVDPPEKREEEEEPREGTGMTGAAELIDLRAQLGLPWRPADLAVSVILRDRISDPLRVQLQNSPGSYRDEAIEEERAKEQLRAPLPRLNPEEPLAADGAPELPEGPGLALAAGRVVKLRAEAPLLVKGSFRVKVPPRLIVDEARGANLPLDPKPAALVPITLVITASKAPAPFVHDLVVPSWQLDRQSGLASGSFAVDLDRVGTLRTVPRTLFVYAFAADQRFGPLPIGLLGDDD